MGRHKEWRKIAKRERRRKIRMKLAETRKQELIDDNLSEDLIANKKEQEFLEICEREEIERQNKIQHEKWLKADSIAVAKWNEMQKKLELTRIKKLEEEIKIQKEWENEQERVKEAQEKLKKMQEENKTRQKMFMDKLELFLSGNANEPPEELLTSRETKPNMEPCPFFQKTACCRFGDVCSRNHQYPGISKTLLASNFYSNFGLENTTVSEYEDVILEYDDSDTYKEFKDFFYDVLPEFEKYGEVVEFKVSIETFKKMVMNVCHNYEKHLRGNTYIEFKDLRCAVAAYRSLHARWYGGKQMSLQFCNIISWRNAICGLEMRKRCPKGRVCNFLHVYRNPISLYKPRSFVQDSPYRERKRERWRWSISPEPERRKERNSTRTKERKSHSHRDSHHKSRSRREKHK